MFVATLLLIQTVLGGIILGAVIYHAHHTTTPGALLQEVPAPVPCTIAPTWPVTTQPTLAAWCPAPAPAAGDAFGTAELNTPGEFWPPLPTLLPGTVLHRFLIEHALGEGSQGRVYLATAPNGVHVALQGMANPVAWAREIVLLRQFAHQEGVPSLIASFQEEQWCWLVLEFVPGFSPQPGLPLEQTLALGAHIAHLLVVLQAQKVIHRDVKPENLRLRPDGRAFLLDFGVAYQPGLPDEQPPGTPGYTAPEQWRGAACPASDVYALGISLWEILSGELPDPLSDEAFPALPPGCPLALERLLRSMLALEAQQRPSAAAVEVCLASLLRGHASVQGILQALLRVFAGLLYRAARV